MLTRLLIALCLMILPGAALAQETVLDDFEDISAWSADASTDISARVSQVEGREGQALRLDYDFGDVSGYAFAARPLTIDPPANYEISFWVRGAGPANTFEVKFTDASVDNVHWRQVTRWEAPYDWTLVTIRRRHIVKAWGPNPDPVYRGSERIEFVIAAGEGGVGFIEVDQLSLRELPPEPSSPPRPIASASSESGVFSAAQAVDGDTATPWRTAAGGDQSLTLDLGYEREFGGVTLRWAENGHASRYALYVSADGEDWTRLREVTDANGGADPIMLTETAARWLRLDLMQGPGDAYALNEIEIQPLGFGEDATAFVTAVAREARRGLYPRGFHGEQPYWTLVGVDGGGDSGLMGEDGAVELGRGGPSVEPFVIENGRVITWADVGVTQSLVDDYLPIPSVRWAAEDWTLDVTAMAEGEPRRAALYGRYVLTNTSNRTLDLALALMGRPLQVNGPVQFLSTPGGVSPVERIDWDGRRLSLGEAFAVTPLSAPDAVTASTFDAGADPQSLIASGREASHSVQDDTGLAAAAMTWRVTLAPGESRTFGWAAPLEGALPALTGEPEAVLESVEQRTAAVWREKLDRFHITVPDEGRRIVDTVRSSLAHILMSRDGPNLKPGTRSYNRSWIRDGAMIAEGLNRLGWVDVSEDYLRWFTPYIFSDGKVPCCVDARGADPVPENDSHGEFIFLAADAYRFGGDLELLRSVWPQVHGAIRYMDQLRASERTAENQTPERRHLYGLLPPTISHEGYSDQPAYSYWDDFWGLLGYKDAVFIAETLGETEAAASIAAARDQFAADIHASIRATAGHHGIDFIAGAADRGDFDPTSTTIGLSPGGEQARLAPDLLANTFERYWTEFTQRIENRRDWDDYTPYELRNVGAFVRLGQRERALAALDFFFADVRPRAWNGWAEVVVRDKREPRFIGDMPHAWISSDYIRSALDLFVHDREGALVLAAGAPGRWLDDPQGLGVEGLRTAFGSITYALRPSGEGWTLTLDGEAAPPDGFILSWPPDAPAPGRTTIDGQTASWSGLELNIPSGARRVEIER